MKMQLARRTTQLLEPHAPRTRSGKRLALIAGMAAALVIGGEIAAKAYYGWFFFEKILKIFVPLFSHGHWAPACLLLLLVAIAAVFFALASWRMGFARGVERGRSEEVEKWNSLQPIGDNFVKLQRKLGIEDK
jgi:hypothetical protein